MADDYVRKSPVAPYIDGLIKEKHANGYKYSSEELVLNRFDRYCNDNGLDSTDITRSFLGGWMEKTDSEGEFNHGKRISCVRQLLLFMATCGMQVYIPHDFCHFKRALPHIFDQEEIVDFFSVVDSNEVPEFRPDYERRLVQEYKLLFRWYLCCGLRNSEAAGIRTEDVDLDNGILTIMNSKGCKDRLVYLPEDLIKSSRKYYVWLKETLGAYPEYFFPSKDPVRPLANTQVDNIFTRLWQRTRYAGCNNKPTVHDFRFTFVVMRMNLWAEQGLDLQVMMPYLSRYLGHKTTKETFYYYFLVQDAYKTVEKKDTIADSVIPEVQHYE